MRVRSAATAGVASLAVVLGGGLLALHVTGPTAVEHDRSGLPERVLAATGADLPGGVPRFDGRLYADPETGCLTLQPPPGLGEESDGWVLGPHPEARHRAIQVTPPDRGAFFAETERGPWPICPTANLDAVADIG